MIKRRGELPKQSVHKLKDGQGTVELQHLFEAENFHGKGRLYALCTIAPGDSIGCHQHQGEQEAYFILEGESLYRENGQEHHLKAGDFALCEDGDSHSIANTGEADLKFIALITNTETK